MAILPAVLKCT